MSSAKNLTVTEGRHLQDDEHDRCPPRPVVLHLGSAERGVPVNVYTGAQIDGLGTDYLVDFGPSDVSCTGASDANWCPLVRKDLQSDPPDYLGVYAVVSYRSVTRLLPVTKTLTDRAITRIEPKVT